MSASTYSHGEAMADRAGPASAVRSAVLALFARLGVGPDEEDDAARARLLEGIAPPPATGRDRTAAGRKLRADAHAAYATVEGAGPAALDMALDVFAQEIEMLEGRARHQAEALKAIRLYAPEPWVRRIAQQVLADPQREMITLPEFLAAPEEDDALLKMLTTRYIG